MTRITENDVMLYRLHPDAILEKKMTQITENDVMLKAFPVILCHDAIFEKLITKAPKCR